MLANRTSNNLNSFMTNSIPTIEIVRDGTIENSQGSTIVQPTGLALNLNALKLAKMESIFSSEDEAALNIASERNN